MIKLLLDLLHHLVYKGLIVATTNPILKGLTLNQIISDNFLYLHDVARFKFRC